MRSGLPRSIQGAGRNAATPRGAVEWISSGRRPLAAIGRAASPRFWAGLPARGLNAAYLELTRSLPAYARRRPDAAPRSASVVSIYYGDADVREPASLPLLDRQASRRMVAARFDMALRALLNEADACLSSCVSERKDRLSPLERRRLRQRLADAAALAGLRTTAIAQGSSHRDRAVWRPGRR